MLQDNDKVKARDQALKILREESRELASYMLSSYSVNLEIDGASGACLFPASNRWLKGEEYGFLIRHYFAYSELLGLVECRDHEHPNSVYN